MTSAASSLDIVTLLQTCWLSFSKGNLPSPDVLSLLLSKVTSCSYPPPPPPPDCNASSLLTRFSRNSTPVTIPMR